MDTVSESSYVTSVDEPISLTDQCTQTTPAPPVRPLRHHTSKLQRHHTCDHIYDVKKNIYGLNRTSLGILKESGSRSRGLGFSDSCPFIVSRGARKLNGFTAVNSWDKPAESPTLSLTSPTSLDYLVNRGGGSPAGSLTPNGILPKQVTSTGVYLTPGYLQNSFPCNQSLSEVALTVGCEEPPTPRTHATSEGLSWRRLHMSRAKLKATATTSELLSGFAMVAMVELQINEPTNVPEWLFVMFAVCTTVLVAVHIFALMISTYLLPNIDAVSKLESPNSCALRDSPHERMRGFIELAWAFSTVLGLFLFLVEVAILCWVKFWDYSFAAATAATVIVIPVLIVFVAFAVHFYHTLVVQKVRSSGEDMEQLENMKRDLDSATVKVNIS